MGLLHMKYFTLSKGMKKMGPVSTKYMVQES